MDEELLLKLICNYPEIYDSPRKGHSSRQTTNRAWENIATCVKFPVEECKKKWKALREKFYREKQKIAAVPHSGMQYVAIPQWPFRSLFEYMFENRKSRLTSANTLLEESNVNQNVNEDTECISLAGSENCDLQDSIINICENSTQFIQQQSQQNQSSYKTLSPQSWSNSNEDNNFSQITTKANKGKKRKLETLDSVVGVLEVDISCGVKNVTKLEPDKISNFAKYVITELRDLPSSVVEEFMDETLIRLLQIKRRHRNQQYN